MSRQFAYVTHWVDYSSKYGLGYFLYSTCTGVVFNDQSKLILDAQGHIVHYMEPLNSGKADTIQTHSLTDFPKALQKKITLLQHFRSYLQSESHERTMDETASM
jgi:polo-like kinase 1